MLSLVLFSWLPLVHDPDAMFALATIIGLCMWCPSLVHFASHVQNKRPILRDRVYEFSGVILVLQMLGLLGFVYVSLSKTGTVPDAVFVQVNILLPTFGNLIYLSK